ncbi:MAG: amidohydrolase family protein [Chloroflexi bacterium]|nr:amidohydrolase family protein [Chloroflexota bacterium]
MSKLDLLVRGGKVVRPRIGVVDADVGIRDGRIVLVAEPGLDLEARRTLEVDGLHVFPGVVDAHAHIGLGGGEEEYQSDTAAAALGGVTAILYYLIDKNSYHPAIQEHLNLAQGKVSADFGYHVTLMTEEHMREIPEIVMRWGIKSFKFFMHFRGDEGLYMGVTGTDDGLLYGMMESIASNDSVLAVHPENIEIAWLLGRRLKEAGREDLAAWNESRPPFVEAEAIHRAGFLAAQVGCPLYLVHITSALALEEALLLRGRFPNLSLFLETCPHYLTHHDRSEIGVLGKVNPPLRAHADLDPLWQGVLDGSFDTVGSDHVGRRLEKKQGTVWQASAGFPGMPTLLPVLLSEGYHKRGLSLERIADLVARRPAEIFKMADRKGDIEVGLDADLAIVDLNWERTPDADWLGTWSDYTIYDGWSLKGWPRYTILRGEVVQQDGEIQIEPGHGQYIAHH